MKFLSKIIFVVAILSSLLSACSDDKDNGGKNKDLVGKWKVVQYYSEEIIDGKIVDTDERSGETFAINEDGSSDFDCTNDEKCTWNYQGGKLHFHWSYTDGETDDMTYNVVKLTSDELTMEWQGSDRVDGVKVDKHEQYQLKKVHKEEATEVPNFGDADKLYIKDDGKDHFVGQDNYIFFKSPNFFKGGRGGEGQHMELIDIGAITWEKFIKMENLKYNSSWTDELIPCIKGHGYFSVEVFSRYGARNITRFYVEDYIKEKGNIVGAIVRF